VPKMSQNPMWLGWLRFVFEREQPPQVVENKSITMEPWEVLEQVRIFRNQQVAGSIPAGGSISPARSP